MHSVKQNEATLAFIGAGNMACAIIGGLLKQGYPAEKIIATARSAESQQRAKALGLTQVHADNRAAVSTADVVILAVKPQMMRDVIGGFADLLRSGQLFISVAAGLETTTLAGWLNPQHNFTPAIVRCMPNTPALVGLGASGLFANPQVHDTQKALCAYLFNAVGISVWVDDENLMDAVTAVSGSGPAYVFMVLEAMQNAAGQLGLPADIARQLSLQTVLGAATLATQSNDAPAELRRKVTSPGGTTERAINTFEQGQLRELFVSAMTAARDRGAELAALNR
jgi:pyrroline-5-carboxylate reductase